MDCLDRKFPEHQHIQYKGGIGAACCLYIENEPSHLIWFDEVPGGGVAAHEALHSVRHIAITIGLGELCEANEEAYAYLLAWTVREIGKNFW